MTTVRVDPATRSAYVEAGARFQQLIPEAARHGLAPLNGSAPHVGVVSYTLGGGLLLLGRSHGWAADQVLAMDVVTADGERRHVTPEAKPDLYWALLGGRDNFRHRHGHGVPAWSRWPGSTAAASSTTPSMSPASGGVRGGGPPRCPDEMNSSVALIPFPDDPQVPEPMRGRRVWHMRIAFTGSTVDSTRLVEPLRRLGPRLSENLRDMPYRAERRHPRRPSGSDAVGCRQRLPGQSRRGNGPYPPQAHQRRVSAARDRGSASPGRRALPSACAPERRGPPRRALHAGRSSCL
ncbi:FAD-dependent oxidoreductase [Streptomyces thinghirensis]|nr:FAD-dependent oxidoreductase [Streptomyces thinghirensis]